MARRLSMGCALTLLALLSVAEAAEINDPMRPAGSSTRAAAPRPGVPALRLEGIMSSGDSRVAIVNGQVVRVGARVAGVEILAILSDGIRYSRGGREQFLMLPGARLSVRVASLPEAKTP